MSYMLVNILNSVLDEQNRRSLADANLASEMTDWENNVNTQWTNTLNNDYYGYQQAGSGGTYQGMTQDEWSQKYNTDQVNMQTNVQETDAQVKTTTGQVTQNQTYAQNKVTACSYAGQMMQYLSGVIKTKL